jgi:hypothetical protein
LMHALFQIIKVGSWIMSHCGEGIIPVLLSHTSDSLQLIRYHVRCLSSVVRL